MRSFIVSVTLGIGLELSLSWFLINLYHNNIISAIISSLLFYLFMGLFWGFQPETIREDKAAELSIYSLVFIVIFFTTALLMDYSYTYIKIDETLTNITIYSCIVSFIIFGCVPYISFYYFKLIVYIAKFLRYTNDVQQPHEVTLIGVYFCLLLFSFGQSFRSPITPTELEIIATLKTEITSTAIYLETTTPLLATEKSNQNQTVISQYSDFFNKRETATQSSLNQTEIAVLQATLNQPTYTPLPQSAAIPSVTLTPIVTPTTAPTLAPDVLSTRLAEVIMTATAGANGTLTPPTNNNSWLRQVLSDPTWQGIGGIVGILGFILALILAVVQWRKGR